MELFTNNKGKKEDLFDKITPVDINGYEVLRCKDSNNRMIREMWGILDIKVFRWYNTQKRVWYQILRKDNNDKVSRSPYSHVGVSSCLYV